MRMELNNFISFGQVCAMCINNHYNRTDKGD